MSHRQRAARGEPAQGDQGRGARGQRPGVVDLRPRTLARGPGLGAGQRAQQRRGERLAARGLRLRGPVLPGGLRADDRRAARRAAGHRALGLRRGRGRRVPVARGVHRGPPRHPARRRPRARRRRGGHADRRDDRQAQGRDEHAPQLPDVRRQLHDHLRLPRRRADRQPRGRAHDAHGRRAVAPVLGARRDRGRPHQAGPVGRARPDRAARRDRAVPAPDGDLPAARRAGPRGARPLVAALLHLRRGAAVGRQAAPGDRRLRPGDDAGLRPDRGARHDRGAAARGVPRRRRDRRRRAAVGLRAPDAAGPGRHPPRGRHRGAAGRERRDLRRRRPGDEGLLRRPRADGRHDPRRLAVDRGRRLPGPRRATCTSPTAART